MSILILEEGVLQISSLPKGFEVIDWFGKGVKGGDRAGCCEVQCPSYIPATQVVALEIEAIEVDGKGSITGGHINNLYPDILMARNRAISWIYSAERK